MLVDTPTYTHWVMALSRFVKSLSVTIRSVCSYAKKINVRRRWHTRSNTVKNLPNKSVPILRRTAAQGRSVFSKHRHHSRGLIVLLLSRSQVSMNGLIHRSFWSCSKSYSSCDDNEPSLFRSKWLNIHLASALQAAGKWAVEFWFKC